MINKWISLSVINIGYRTLIVFTQQFYDYGPFLKLMYKLLLHWDFPKENFSC